MSKPQKNYREHRPLIHYSVPSGWMNDPNGLIYMDGKYHLFYQYYPAGLKHGPMHWGHAISKDLCTWETLPIALFPDELGVIFSGSAIIDKRRVTGIGGADAAPVLAFFTHHTDHHVQYQSIAYSTDGGMHFQKYRHNPVLINPAEKNFRDPKVFWHEESSTYIMAIAAGRRILFYSSVDLLHWENSGQYAVETLRHSGTLECPDLLRFSCRQQDKWSLVVSLTQKANDDWCVVYIIGDFDGKNFIPDETNGSYHRLDGGIDHYAAVSFSNVPDGRTILLGWMNYWGYADRIPAGQFRGSMTIPREVGLIRTPQGLRLSQFPVGELFARLRRQQKLEYQHEEFSISLCAAPFAVKLSAIGKGFRMTLRNRQDSLLIYLDETMKTICCDRSACGIIDFHPKYKELLSAEIPTLDETLDLLAVVDVTSLELFLCEGTAVLTVQFFIEGPFEELVIRGGAAAGEMTLHC